VLEEGLRSALRELARKLDLPPRQCEDESYNPGC